jgi:hypothetical protein
VIIYTGCKNQVLHQLKCDHKWHGPTMTFMGRHMTCSKCKCRDYLEIKSQRTYEAKIRQMEKACGVE